MVLPTSVIVKYYRVHMIMTYLILCKSYERPLKSGNNQLYTNFIQLQLFDCQKVYPIVIIKTGLWLFSFLRPSSDADLFMS